MPLEKEMLLNLNLQLFAEDEDDLSGDDELIAAINSLKESENESEDEEEYEDEYEEEDEEEHEDEDEYEDSDEDDDEEYEDEDDDEYEDEEEEDEEEEEEPVKKKQSKEDNAKFAEKRRQSEVQKRVEAELERLKNESPEYKLAKSLSERFGKPVEQIMAEMEEAALVEESKQSKVPVEILRNQKAANDRADQLQAQLNQIKFDAWKTQIEADSAKLVEQYPVLDQDDLDEAKDYILNTVKNVDFPLEQAVFAVHGKKIIDSLANAKVQDKLASESGRKKKNALPPNNGTAKKTKQLTSDEVYIAKQFGMTHDDYIKFKQ